MNNSPRDIIFNLILEFLSSNKSFKIINESTFKNLESFSRRDKNFITNISKGILRYKNVLDYNIAAHSKIKKIDKKTLSLLYIGIYQLLYCDSIPDYAAVNSTVNLAKSKHKKSTNFINAILRKTVSFPFKINQDSSDKDYEKVDFMHSKWFNEKLKNQYSKSVAIQILKSNLKKPKLWIRVNLLKTNITNIKKILNNNKISFKEDKYINFFLKIDDIKSNDIISKLLNEGLIYIQNPSSGHIVNIINSKPNETILDACSAPGGKASLIAQIMNNKVKIICMDINKDRIVRLKKNLSLLDILNVNFLCDNAIDYKSKIKYDKIILDLPCSSSGTINKNPDIKWRINKKSLSKYQKTQYSILNNMKDNVKIGGEIIYSTCSIFNDENEYNILKFLDRNSNFSISCLNKSIPKEFITQLGAMLILPNANNYEGMFAIKLTKNA